MSYSSLLSSSYQPHPHDSLGRDESFTLTTSHDTDASYELEPLPEQRGDEAELIVSSKSFARAGHGIWKNQMLVDRSLWSMAILTSFLAFCVILVVVICLPAFIHRENKQSTSIYRKPEGCRAAFIKISIVHLIINIAATMVLGMSNTYQQLVTALDVEDIPHMLREYGDGKVGTNSPWTINRKTRGKKKAWLSWLLLITTSLPVHLVANSVIGLSSASGLPSMQYKPGNISRPATKYDYVIRPPSAPGPTPTLQQYTPDNISRLATKDDFGCWSAFRTGSLWWLYDDPPTIDSFVEESITTAKSLQLGGSHLTVEYDHGRCERLRASASSVGQLLSEYVHHYQEKDGEACVNSLHVVCSWEPYDSSSDDSNIQCRISLRMQAALTLGVALLLKALYMLAWNLRRRDKLKTKCLTFGDVVAAAALNPNIQVANECLVNSSEHHRQHVNHICHKHCKSDVVSSSGDEIGHCQSCKKHNTTDKAAGLEHPIVATKYKKSLISNLGFTAVIQMILLMFCLLCMLGVSMFIAVITGESQQSLASGCRDSARIGDRNSPVNKTYYNECMDGNWNPISGGWGGHNAGVALALLPMDKMGSESLAIGISNGAQLIYSLLYLLLIYNLTLISMEYDWGTFETTKQRFRCTIYKGGGFSQSYMLQLPKKVIYPLMGFSAMMHWLLGQAISTQESLLSSPGVEQFGIPARIVSQYKVVWAAYPVWLTTLLMLAMTSVCWWAFSYSREGYMPQMYGSIRVCCASTTDLHTFPSEGIEWGDLGKAGKFRHAGFSDSAVGDMIPGELYCGGKERDGSPVVSEKL